MANLFNKASVLTTANAYKASKVYSIIPTDGSGDLTYTRASLATRRNSFGRFESLANNVPQLNYPSVGSCPFWWLEPQRTNLVLYSNNYLDASWSNSNLTVTSNDDGFGASRLLSSGTNIKRMLRAISLTAGDVCTVSIVAKNKVNGTTNKFNFGNFATGYTTVITTDNWATYTFTFTAATTTSYTVGIIEFDTTTNFDIQVFNIQAEIGSYATSPIITTGAIVTRVAAGLNKSGIASLIGQTEGTMYLEFNYNSAAPSTRLIGISESSLANRIILVVSANKVQVIARYNNTTFANITSSATLINGKNKIAIAYISGSIALFINGVLDTTNTDTFAFNIAPSILYIGTSEITGVVTDKSEVYTALLAKTKFSNSECVALTTL